MAPRYPLRLSRAANRIAISGGLGLSNYRRLLATIHNAVSKLDYDDLHLDFRGCESAFPGPMLALCADVGRLRRDGRQITITLPTSKRLRTLFLNSGWAHQLDPINQDESQFKGYVQVPVIQFSSPGEQHNAVNRMVDAVLCSQTQLSRSDLAAIEWAINEIIDNVINHSQSVIGGFAQLSNYKSSGRVEFSVSDAGLGIPVTLKEGHPEIQSDTEALDLAIREGVTRNKELGQGNGLFGTLEITHVGTGYLHVHSGYASFDQGDSQLRTKSEQIPFKGTLVVAALDVSDTEALGAALRFEGKRYEPLDYLEIRYESSDGETIRFRLKEEVASFGSRKAGGALRTKLSNLVRMNPGVPVLVDFTDIPLVSSSFADEVFGKLFVELGALRFMQAIRFQGMADTVSPFVDRAILQRARDA